MPWLLSADGVNDHVTIPNPLTGNAGTDAYTVEFFGSIPTAPVSNRLLFGVAAGTVSNGFAITPTGQLSVFAAGTSRYASAAGFIIFDTTRRKYRLEHDAGGAWRMYRDDALISSGTFSTSVAFAGLGLFFRINPTSAGFLRFDLGYFETTGLANSQRWDATLSGGSGSVLPTVSGTNQGALVDFTVPDCWVFYSSGATYDLQALGGTFTYSGATAALNRGFRLDVTGGSFSYFGASAELTYSSVATVYRIDALGGNFTYAGAQASLLRNFRVDAAGGAYSYAGGTANLTVTGPMVYTITALGGTFSYTGSAAEFTATGVIPIANPAAFVNRAYVGGRLTNSAKIGGRLTNNATVAI